MSEKLDDHYTDMGIEPIEYSFLNKLDPYQHTVVKYVSRYKAKGGLRDLKAAQLLLGKYIDRIEEDEALRACGYANPAEEAADYNTQMRNLLDQIIASNVVVGLDRIVVIPRGGLTVAHLIAEVLDFKEVELYDPSIIYEGNVLLVDDINDSGSTLIEILSKNPERFRNGNVLTAVLVQRYSSKVNADFIGAIIKHDDYVVFPWENRNGN